MNRIKEQRIKHSFSQSELAHEIEKTPQLVSLYEKGDREPKLETWRKMARIFKVSIPYLQGVAVDRETFETSAVSYIWEAINQPDSELANVSEDYLRMVDITFEPIGGTPYETSEGLRSLLENESGEGFMNAILSDVLPAITADLYPQHPNGLREYGSYGEKIPADEYIGDAYTTPEKAIVKIMKRYRNSKAHGVNLENRNEPISFRGKLLTDRERDHLISDVAEMRGDHLNGDD